MQFGNFGGEDGTTPAPKNFDVTGPAFVEQVKHVLKKLDMATLITGYGNALHVFLNGTVHNFGGGAVVAEVNHFGSRRLHQPTHQINGRIMAVEK